MTARLATNANPQKPIAESSEKIGTLAFMVQPNGALDVLMQRTSFSNHWKLPQTDLDLTRRDLGHNTRRLLTDTLGIPSEDYELWSSMPLPLIERLPEAEARRKGFRQTVTSWSCVVLNPAISLPNPSTHWMLVPRYEMLEASDFYRQKGYQMLQDMLPTEADMFLLRKW